MIIFLKFKLNAPTHQGAFTAKINAYLCKHRPTQTYLEAPEGSERLHLLAVRAQWSSARFEDHVHSTVGVAKRCFWNVRIPCEKLQNRHQPTEIKAAFKCVHEYSRSPNYIYTALRCCRIRR